MSGQPMVSALSVCGPAVGRTDSYGDFEDIFRPKNIIQLNAPPRSSNRSVPLSARENTAFEKQVAPPAVFDQPKPRQSPPPPLVPKTTKKTPVPANQNQKPPFLVGKAPIRSQLAAVPKPQPLSGGSVDNRAEIADLKRQIGELSHLLRLHVDTNDKTTKRDVGTDPIIFEDDKVDAATTTDSVANLCSRCKRVVAASLSPIQPSVIIEDSPEEDTSLCSQLESLAMQYLSDDQLANIAHGNRVGALVAKKPSSSSKKHRKERQQPIADSPPKRRVAAVATTTESNTISPNFGNNGGLTLTRRRVMTMEHQVSIFGGGSRGGGGESLPLGFSVASQEFMHRHGVLKTTSSKPPSHLQRRGFESDNRYGNRYDHRDRHRGHQGDYYEDSVVEAPRRYHNYNQQQFRDAEEYFDDVWD